MDKLGDKYFILIKEETLLVETFSAWASDEVHHDNGLVLTKHVVPRNFKIFRIVDLEPEILH